VQRHPQSLTSDHECGTEKRGYCIGFGSQNTWDLHHQKIANLSPAYRRDHSESCSGNRSGVESERFVRARRAKQIQVHLRAIREYRTFPRHRSKDDEFIGRPSMCASGCSEMLTNLISTRE